MTKRKLDIGSGFAPANSDEFEHLDANPNAPHVEYICDAFGPLPFDDGAFDELRAVDILEHGSYRRTDEILAEWVRILKPGGRIFVQVPDFGTIARWYVNHDPRLQMWERGQQCSVLHGAQWRLIGGCDDGRFVEEGGDPHLNVHMALFDEHTLTAALERAGFVVTGMHTNGHPNIQVSATRA